jgi:hypothetical protein
MKLRFHHDGGNEHYHDEDDNDRVYSTAEVNKMLRAPHREFCQFCGAGIGEHRRAGEGTCPKCDPDGCRDNWNVLQDKCPVKRRLVNLAPAAEDVTETPLTPGEQSERALHGGGQDEL